MTKYGVSYYPAHVYRVLRAKNKKGGGPMISPKEFDEEILGWIYTRVLMEYSELMPECRISKALVSVDKVLPDELVNISRKIKKFFDGHGPFSPLAIGLMNCIIDMERKGIDDSKVYFSLLERLDENPAQSFSDYVRIVTEFEKELEK